MFPTAHLTSYKQCAIPIQIIHFETINEQQVSLQFSVPFTVLSRPMNITVHIRGRFPAAAAAFMMDAESKNGLVFQISTHVKDPLVVKN